MQRILIVGLVAAVAGCDRGDEAGAQVDPSQLTNSTGEVALSDGGSMSFTITSERYKQWDQARRAFPRTLIQRFGQVLQPRAPTERSINNAIALLESNARARQAIEGAGLSVRGFVELTVALEQQMLLASGDGRPEPPPMPEGYPMTMDTTYYQSYPYAPVPAPVTPMPVTPMPVTPSPVTAAPTYIPYPTTGDSTARRDSLPPTPTPVPTPTPTPVPAPRRDTVLPRRDSVPVRRDTMPAPAPRHDTTGDTLRATPGASTSRDSTAHA